MVGAQYKPAEVARMEWETIASGPPWAVDAWGLGCLIREAFSGAPLRAVEQLRETEALPPALLADYQRLLSSAPARRLNPAQVAESKFLNNQLVKIVAFMEGVAVKDAAEKEAFFRRLPALLPAVPAPVAARKLLPLLAGALEFGGAPAVAVGPLLQIGKALPQEDFLKRVVPCLARLFASPDRALRRSLLEAVDAWAPHLTQVCVVLSSCVAVVVCCRLLSLLLWAYNNRAKDHLASPSQHRQPTTKQRPNNNPTTPPQSVVEDQIYPSLQSGFADDNAYIRELTLKATLALAPKLKQATLAGPLLRHLNKLQMDPEPSIRANTTVLLGNIADLLGEATCKKVLLNAFGRALRDPFPPARVAALRALAATVKHYSPEDAACRALPAAAPLAADAVGEVRAAALAAAEALLKLLRDNDARVSREQAAAAAAAGAAGGPAAAGGSAALGAGAAGMLGWAMSSLVGGAAGAGGSGASTPPPQQQQGAGVGVGGPAGAPRPGGMGGGPAPAAPAAAAARPTPAAPAAAASPAAAADGWGDDDDEEFEDMEEKAARSRLSGGMALGARSSAGAAAGASGRAAAAAPAARTAGGHLLPPGARPPQQQQARASGSGGGAVGLGAARVSAGSGGGVGSSGGAGAAASNGWDDDDGAWESMAPLPTSPPAAGGAAARPVRQLGARPLAGSGAGGGSGGGGGGGAVAAAGAAAAAPRPKGAMKLGASKLGAQKITFD